jgi:hypothetical protein
MVFLFSWISTILRAVLIVGLEIAKPLIKRLVVVYPTNPLYRQSSTTKRNVGYGFGLVVVYALLYMDIHVCVDIKYIGIYRP